MYSKSSSPVLFVGRDINVFFKTIFVAFSWYDKLLIAFFIVVIKYKALISFREFDCRTLVAPCPFLNKKEILDTLYSGY